MLPTSQSQLSTVLTGGQMDVSLLLEDANGNWVDLTSLLGKDWVLSVEYSSDVDESVSGGSVTLAKADHYRSLSPLVTDDQISASFGNLIRAPAKAKLIVDGVEAAYWSVTEYSLDPASVTLHVADYLPSLLANRWIAQDVVYGSGMDMGEVAQRIIDYAFGGQGYANIREPTIDAVAGKAYHNVFTRHSYLCTVSGSHADNGMTWPTTLGETFTRGSATFRVLEPIPQIYIPAPIAESTGSVVVLSPGNPLGLLEDLASQIGYIIRQRYIAGQWRLTIEEPEREGTSAALTLGPDTYEALTDISHAHADVRNAIEVFFRSGTDRDSEQVGHIESVTRFDSTSIDKYGYRYASIGNDDAVLISSPSQATKLAIAALADLKDPVASISIRTPYLYPLEVGDIVTLLADGQDLSSDYECSVLSISHTIANDELSSEVKLKLGKPIAGIRRWSNRIKVPGTVPVPQVVPQPLNIAATPGVRSATVSWQESGAVDSQGRVRVTGCEVHVGTTAGFVPGPGTLRHVGKSPYVLTLNPGTEVFVKLRAKDIAGNLSAPTEAVSVTALGVPGSDLADGSIPSKALMTPPAENLIPNGYSEAGAKAMGMEPEGRWLSYEPIHALTGDYCRKRVLTDGGSNNVRFSDPIPVTPGEKVSFSAWIKGSSAIGAGAIWLLMLNADGERTNIGDASRNAQATTTWTEYRVTATIPAGTSYVVPYYEVNGTAHIGKTVYLDCLSARRAIVGDLIVGNTIQTSNFVSGTSDGAAYAVAGAKLDSQDTALLVHENGMRIGKTYAGDPIIKAHNALDGALGSPRGFLFRGNNNPDVLGGAPNIETVSLHLVQLNYRPGDNFTYATMELRITPTSLNDNLDGINVASIGCYNTNTQSLLNTNTLTWTDPAGFMGLYQAMPSRGYGSASHAAGANMARINFPFQASGDRILRRATTGAGNNLVVFYIRIYNTYGGSAGKWFYFEPSGNTATAVDQIGGQVADPGSGGGRSGGGGGGYCLDPDSLVDMADYTSKRAGDIQVGDYVMTRWENDGPGLEEFRKVTDYSQVWADERYKLTTTDGRFIIASKGHKMRGYDFSWMPIEDCAPGTELFGSLGHFAPAIVASVEPAAPGMVCKITVDRTHTLFANGLWQSNAKPL